MALLSVEPCDRGSAPRVKVRLMVEAPGVILRPCRRDGTTPQQQQQPPDWTAYTDGSEDGGRAGWAYAVVMGGDGISDENAMLVTERYGGAVSACGAFSLTTPHGTTTSRLTRVGPNGQRVRDGVCDGENLPGGERTTSELSSSSVAAFSVEARSDMETRQGAQWS